MRVSFRVTFILLFLTVFRFVASAAPVALSREAFSIWLGQPVVQFLAASYMTSNENTPQSEKIVDLIERLEKALLDRPAIQIASFEQYLQIRNHNTKTISAFLAEVDATGIVNPLNIITPNSELYEKILNYEISQLREVLQQTLPLLPQDGVVGLEIKSAVDSLNLLLDTYRSVVDVRDELEIATRTWEGVPVLGFLRAMGQYVVTPVMNSMTHSAPVINHLRASLRKQFAVWKVRLPHEIAVWQTALRAAKVRGLEAMLEQNPARNSSTEWVIKTLQSWPEENLLNIEMSFLKELPPALQQDLVWYLFKNRNNLSQPLALILSYPQKDLILDHFKLWIQQPNVKVELQKLSNLPISEVLYSASHLIQNTLGHDENKSSQWLGDLGAFKFYAVEKSSHLAQQDLAISLEDYLQKYPQLSQSLQQKIARIVIQNTFESGLTTVLGRSIFIVEGANPGSGSVYFSALVGVEALPRDTSARFIQAMSDLPLKYLLKSGSSSIEENAAQFQNLSENDQTKISDFLRRPENLRWVLQLDQLRQTVDESILKSEIRSYVLKHPRHIFQFFKSRWFPKHHALQCRTLFN